MLFIFFYVYGVFCLQFSALDQEGIRSPRTEVTAGYEAPSGHWELNLGPVEEQPTLLSTEPSLQLPDHHVFKSSS